MMYYIVPMICFTLFQIIMYGAFYKLLNMSSDWKTDIYYIIIWYIWPLLLAEYIWIQGWRVGKYGEIDSWVLFSLAIFCSYIGGTLSFWFWFQQSPKLLQIVGLSMMLAGSLVCAWANK